MQPLKMPPRIKVLEAVGSLADGRVKLLDEKKAQVTSSLGDKTYTVAVDIEKRLAYSDDNGTRYRGYVGYPIIAVLMKKGVLSYNERIAEALKGIKWKTLNERYKKYWLVEKIVKNIARRRGVEPGEIDEYVEQVLSQLNQLELRLAEDPDNI